ncbi:MAG TPA: LysE family transporter [Longimicrobiales bacterium]|nr:LysE family transporter [Longimicrobiales bacterium]
MDLLSAVLPALILGLAAGMAPGPYTTMVVATGLERGFRAALPLAMAPFVTDLAPLLLTSLLLTSLSPRTVGIMGWVGGIVVVAIGLRLVTRHWSRADPRTPKDGGPATVRFWHVVAGTVLSPAPWIFWLGLGTPLFLRQWGKDWRLGLLFLVVLFVTNIASAAGLAWAASHGRHVMAPYWRTRMLRALGAALIGAGGFLIFQASQGNLGVDQPELLDAILDVTEEVR